MFECPQNHPPDVDIESRYLTDIPVACVPLIPGKKDNRDNDSESKTADALSMRI